MKIIVGVVGFVIAVIWDFTQNDGHVTHSVVAAIVHFSRSVGY